MAAGVQSPVSAPHCWLQLRLCEASPKEGRTLEQAPQWCSGMLVRGPQCAFRGCSVMSFGAFTCVLGPQPCSAQGLLLALCSGLTAVGV